MKSRDDAEAALALVVDQTTRTFLQRVLDAVVAAIHSGRTDQAQPVLALGVLLGWWTDAVGERVVEAVQESWQAAFGVTSGGRVVVSPRSDAMAFHITAVRDRLSRSALPEIPEAAFDQVRLSQSAAALGGWSIPQQARDVAERLAWEPDKAYWKDQKAAAEAEIDKILDPLGKPGTAARTHAHKNDPQVKVWQAVRAEAVDKIREHESDWRDRATRIARTESTAAWNSGALAALAEEGRTHKRWLASACKETPCRTRPSHQEANGQVVPLARQFKVGESLLMMPGDPSAPPWEVINCRCTVLGADAPKAKSLTAAAGGDHWKHELRIPKGNGDKSGQWVLTPWMHLDNVLSEMAETELWVTVKDQEAWGAKVKTRVDVARDVLAGVDTSGLNPNDPKVAVIADVVGQLFLDAAVASKDLGLPSKTLEEAAKATIAFGKYDWSLFNEDTDIGAEDFGDLVGEETSDIGAGEVKQAKDVKVGDTVSIHGGWYKVGAVNVGDGLVQIVAENDEAADLFEPNEDVEVKPGDALDPADTVAVKAALEALDVGEVLSVGGWHVIAWQGKGKTRVYRAGHDPGFPPPDTITDWAYYGSAYTGAQGLSEEIAHSDLVQTEQVDDGPTKKAKDLKPGDMIVVGLGGGELMMAEVSHVDEDIDGKIFVVDTEGHERVFSPDENVSVVPKPDQPTKKAKDVVVGDVIMVYDFPVEVVDAKIEEDVWGGPPYVSITSSGGQTYAYTVDDDVTVVKAAASAGLPSAKGWAKVGAAKGSNPGGTYHDPVTDEQFYVKHSKSDLHARNEALAAKLYALAGVETTDPHLVTYGDSDQHLGTAAKIIEGQQNLQQNLSNPIQMSKVWQGFAADAWLGNWDVVGLGYDNILTLDDAGQTPVRVDLGGSLLFRAQGTPKGAAFGEKVDEWESLRNQSTNPQSASVFGKMSDAQLKDSAKSLQGISDGDIDAAVDEVFGKEDKETAATLKATLKARRDDVLKKAGLDKPEKASGPAAVPVGESVLLLPGGTPVEYTKVDNDEWQSVDPETGQTVTNSDADLADAWDSLFQQEAAPEKPADMVEASIPITGSQIEPGDALVLDGAVLKKAGGKLTPSTGAAPTVAEVKHGPKWASIVTTTGQKLWVASGDPLTVKRKVQPTTFDVQTHKVQPGDALVLSGPVLKKSAGKLIPAEAEKQGKHDARPVVASIKHGPKWTEVVTTSGQKLWIPSGDTVTVKHTPGLEVPGATVPGDAAWKGKPAPVAPAEPEAPVEGKPPKGAFDAWLNKVKARYDANPNKAKASLEQSLNWSTVQNVMSGDPDLADPALKKLLTSQYLDQALHDEAVKIYQAAAVLPPGAQAKYDKAHAAWLKAMQHHEDLLAAWQKENPTSLKGMNGAKVFSSNEEGVAWANKTLAKPPPDTHGVIKDMKGSSGYVNGQLWNNGGKVPDSVKTQVASLDKAMSPIQHDIYLFRGTNMSEFKGIANAQQLKNAVGTTFVQHGFQPTGLGVDTHFSGSPVQIVYRAPAGTKGVWARPIKPPPFNHEREFMLARNTRYFIHKVTEKGGQIFVEAEIIPEGHPDPSGQPSQALTQKVGTYFARLRRPA